MPVRHQGYFYLYDSRAAFKFFPKKTNSSKPYRSSDVLRVGILVFCFLRASRLTLFYFFFFGELLLPGDNAPEQNSELAVHVKNNKSDNCNPP